MMQPLPSGEAASLLPNPVNTTMSGNFTASEAFISWVGTYWGGFRSLDYSSATIDDGPKGSFRVTFNGKIDNSKSDPLKPLAYAPAGQSENLNNPSWEKAIERTVPEVRFYYISNSDNSGNSSSLATILYFDALMLWSLIGVSLAVSNWFS